MGRTDILQEVETLLSDKETAGEKLREYVLRLHRDGMSQDELLDVFTEFMVFFREAGRDEDDDRMYDLLDSIAGNCHPKYRLF